MKKEYDFKGAKWGAVISQKGKSRITIYFDNDILDAFRDKADAAGRGYQTMINDALREYLFKSSKTVDAETLRRIIREELRKAS